MEQINLIDYIGDSTKEGQPVGHPLKVCKEIDDIFREMCSTNLIVPFSYKNSVDNNKVSIFLKYYAIRDIKGTRQIIKNYVNEYKNLLYIWKEKKEGVLYFYNTDYVINLFLILHRKKKRKIIVNSYTYVSEGQKYYVKILKKFLINLSLRKIDLFLYANRNFKSFNCKQIYFPDYFCNMEIREKYLNQVKKDKIICLGTMSNEHKELKKLVEVFSENKIELEIIGKFYDKELYEELCLKATENIKIKNEYIEYEDYLRKLAESRFSILPYKVEAYEHKTTGILLESIFMDTIPIAPEKILKSNDVQGISYNSLEELGHFDFAQIDGIPYETLYEVYRKERYSKELAKKRLKNALEELKGGQDSGTGD